MCMSLALEWSARRQVSQEKSEEVGKTWVSTSRGLVKSDDDEDTETSVVLGDKQVESIRLGNGLGAEDKEGRSVKRG